MDGAERRIGRRSRQLLLKAESRDAIRVSPASIFELTALHTVGRLRLSRPPEQWIRESLQASGARIAELTAAVAIDAGTIPRSALADPLDRLLVATARQIGATLLTSDSQILTYASATRNLRVHDAAR